MPRLHGHAVGVTSSRACTGSHAKLRECRGRCHVLHALCRDRHARLSHIMSSLLGHCNLSACTVLSFHAIQWRSMRETCQWLVGLRSPSVRIHASSHRSGSQGSPALRRVCGAQKAHVRFVLRSRSSRRYSPQPNCKAALSTRQASTACARHVPLEACAHLEEANNLAAARISV